ncbi:MAG: RHS repeat domain-containing protein [Acidobacteriota bacterium]
MSISRSQRTAPSQVAANKLAAGGGASGLCFNHARYDPVNRLSQASETTTVAGATGWSIGFEYDRYGNMAAKDWTLVVPTAMAASLAQYNGPLNRRDRTVSGVAMSPNPYDKAGNLISDAALGTMQYDQAGRLRRTQVLGKTVNYDYDAEGRRVRRDLPGLGTTNYVYDGSGQLAAKYGASEPSGCSLCYLTADMLGSTRLVTDGAGGVNQRMGYLPFGDIVTASLTQGGGRNVITDGTAQTTYALASASTQRFTGKERDAETGLDYMDFRYYGGAQGRFMSPDPLMASANVADPQSWNRYVYARNNPLKYTDPLGLFPSPTFNCAEGSAACLNDEQRRILNASNIEIGGKSYSGEALYNKLNEKQQNAFVNNTDRLASIKVEGGGTALGMVQAITANPDNGKVPTDRIFAVVDPKLASSIGGNIVDFTKVDMIPGQHPGADLSFKSRNPQGNIQFSFNATRTVADIDHDLCVGACHVAEATFNTLFSQKTDQNKVRELLIKMPGVGITPSPDPKFNRK